MDCKFLVSLPTSLRQQIKRQARKEGISMNEYIVTVLTQFVELQRGNSGRARTQKSIGESQG